MELEPRNSVINDHLGDAYWAAGREREARFQWTRALGQEPEAADIPKIEAKLREAMRSMLVVKIKSGEGAMEFATVDPKFAPAMIGGMYWRGGTRDGALAGLLAGFAVWAYTLLLPSFSKSGWLPADTWDGL